MHTKYKRNITIISLS